jgi:hypothetical protein
VRVDLHGSRDGKGRINITGDTGDMGVNNRKENN